MYAKTGDNIRDLVNQVNTFNEESPEHPIQREDIISILHVGGQYIMTYFN